MKPLLPATLGVLLLVLVATQLVLPWIAARVLSSRVARYGSIASVEVSAWPAIKLLWGAADSVRVRAHSLDLSPSQGAGLLAEAHGAETLDASVERVQLGPLRLTGVQLRKRAGRLSAAASVSARDVTAALPAGVGVQLLSSAGGEVEIRASGALFGLGASVVAVALEREGRLVVRPRGLLGGFQLTLFADPRIAVEGVAASVESDHPRAYRLAMTATLR